MDATITSAAWGSIAAEIKSLGTTVKLAPGRYYMALHCTGTTATIYQRASGPSISHAGCYLQASLTAGLPSPLRALGGGGSATITPRGVSMPSPVERLQQIQARCRQHTATFCPVCKDVAELAAIVEQLILSEQAPPPAPTHIYPPAFRVPDDSREM